MNFLLTPLSTNLPKSCMFLLLFSLGTILALSCPASCQPSCSLPPLVWVRPGGLVPPLQPLYDGPYAVLRRSPCSFTIRVGSRDKMVAVSRLKACTATVTMPGSPGHCGRQLGFAPRRSCCNQAGLVLRPAGLLTFFFSGSATRWSWNRFPTWRGGFCVPGTGGAITGATDAVPVPSTGTATEVGPLTSSPSQGLKYF
jgi:hypothetical protein